MKIFGSSEINFIILGNNYTPRQLYIHIYAFAPRLLTSLSLSLGCTSGSQRDEREKKISCSSSRSGEMIRALHEILALDREERVPPSLSRIVHQAFATCRRCTKRFCVVSRAVGYSILYIAARFLLTLSDAISFFSSLCAV